MPDQLAVDLHGTTLGRLRRGAANRLLLTFTDEAFDRWHAGSRVLSVALPIQRGEHDATPFFAGLLPDNAATQERIGVNYGIDGGDRYALLEAIGRDCAGAVTVRGPAPDAGIPRLQPISASELHELVMNLPATPLGATFDHRVSLGGNQAKLLLARTASGGWALPLDGYPSTHILKPEPLDLPDYVGDEVLCMRLAHRIGLTTAEADAINVNGRPVYVVPRFDRGAPAPDGTPTRVHQEDFSQALGRLPADRWERPGEHRYTDIGRLLARTAPDDETVRFAQMIAFNVAIGNADAHDKNYGMLHDTCGDVLLAPLYDATNTTVKASTNRASASSVNGVTDIDHITVDDVIAETASWGRRRNRRVAAAVRATLDQMAEHFDEVEATVWVDGDIADALRARIGAMRAGRPAGAY